GRLVGGAAAEGGDAEVVELVPIPAGDADRELLARDRGAHRVAQRDGGPASGAGGLGAFGDGLVGAPALGEQLDAALVVPRTFVAQREGLAFNQRVGEIL